MCTTTATTCYILVYTAGNRLVSTVSNLAQKPPPLSLLLLLFLFSYLSSSIRRYCIQKVKCHRNTRARFYDTLSSRTRSKSLERTRCPPSSSVPHLTLPSTLSTRRRRRSRWFPKTRLCLSCSLFYRRRPIP